MEKKTIGGFIAALRKANGYTQQQLAEKLNVSDKTISRWERDECAPEITLLPAMAELFGVTVDELLRGGRTPQETLANGARGRAKSDKQLRNLLRAKLTAYKNNSIVAAALGVVGLLAAVICNFGFMRAQVGFFVAVLFYAAAIFCEVIFTNNAKIEDDEEFDSAVLAAYRLSVLSVCKSVVVTVVTLFFATLPLLVFAPDPFVGLTIDWLLFALGGTAIGFLLSFAAFTLITRGEVQKNKSIALTEQGLKRDAQKKKLLKKYAAAYTAVTLVIAIATITVNALHPKVFAKGLSFDDYASFKTYVETPDSSWGETGDERPLDTILSPDGKVLCEYTLRNEYVARIEPSDDADGLPIKVYTDQALGAADVIKNDLTIILAVVFLAETIVIWCVYSSKSRALTHSR